MDDYSDYVDHLGSILEDFCFSSMDRDLDNSKRLAEEALNGQANAVLRKFVPLETRREKGTFFSSSKLANLVSSLLADSLTDQSVILDPMCGSGDLLIHASHHLELGATFEDTINQWERRLLGNDLHSSFALAAKKRLTIAAFARHEYSEIIPKEFLERSFPNIHRQCGLSDLDSIQRATHILLNPPYLRKKAPKTCDWAQGRVSTAALDFEHFVKTSRPNTRIIAILPEVLRSGTNYNKWRENIESLCHIDRCQIYGRFDQSTDVDVFILDVVVSPTKDLNKEATSAAWIQQLDTPIKTLGDFFEVRVGPVVNYRDPKRGPWRAYLPSKGLASWCEVEHIERNRRFTGKVFKPPFIVLRRTSRPEDRFRATATIINCIEDVAVENHLIVLAPKDGLVQSCRDALAILKDARTSDWLNNRIRCRHLTVGAIRGLPWWGA